MIAGARNVFSKQNASPKREMFGEVGMKLKWNFSWQVQALVKVAMMLECNFWWQVQFGYVGVQLSGATCNLLDIHVLLLSDMSVVAVPRFTSQRLLRAVLPLSHMNAVATVHFTSQRLLRALYWTVHVSRLSKTIKHECRSYIAFCISEVARHQTRML